MAIKLATQLMRARSARVFLQGRRSKLRPRDLASLNGEVDKLVRSDLKAAIRLVDKIEDVSRIARDPCAGSYAKASRARVLDYQGRHLEAIHAYQEAVHGMRSAGLRLQAAALEREKLYGLTCLGRYDEALQTARSARRVLRGVDSYQLAQLEANVGLVYYRMDQYKKSLRHYDKAGKVIWEAGSAPDRALLDFSRSNVLMELDRHEEALQLLKRAAAGFEKAKRRLQAGQARFHIAYLHFKRGEYRDALAGYYAAQDRLAALGAIELVAWCNLDIAEILLALNAFEGSMENAARALDEFTRLSMPYETAQATLVRGLAMMGDGNLESARADLTAARKYHQTSGNKSVAASVDSYLAELALRAGDPNAALSASSASFDVFARSGLAVKAAHSQLLMARACFSLGQTSRALANTRAATTRVRGVYAPHVEYQCHHLMGQLLKGRGDGAAARQSFISAVDVIERMRGGIVIDEFKSTFLADKIPIYEDAINSCLEAGTAEFVRKAFRIVESSKSRALADLLARFAKKQLPRGSKADRELVRIRQKLLKLIRDLNWYGSRADSRDERGERRAQAVANGHRHKAAACERQVSELFRRVELRSPSSEFSSETFVGSIDDLGQSLASDETAIEYFITGDDVSAFVVDRTGARVARAFASRRDVESALSRFRFQVDRFGCGETHITARGDLLKESVDRYLSELYEAVFEPLELMIRTTKLLIIPHGALHYVPFHALNDGQGYLADVCEISQAPSAAVFKLCKELGEKKRKKGRPYARDLATLGILEQGAPRIEDEVRALAAMFPNSAVMLGQDATYRNLLRAGKDARFLHIASHGYFRQDNPMFSFLKLSDSQLNFYGLLSLKLNAEMVTLSACQTGVNAIFPGDELHGLMRGFLQAGTPSMVVSLWRASDRATAELMVEMYRRIGMGETKRAALNAAHRKVKEIYPHPYYWAPFILMGSPL